MRAAVFHGAKDIRVTDVPAPTEVGPGQVLVQTRDPRGLVSWLQAQGSAGRS